MNFQLQSRLEQILGEPIQAAVSVSGGCIADARQLQMLSGKQYFLKQARGGNTGILQAEARGLTELRRVDAVRVPEVLAEASDFLVLEWIPVGQKNSESGLRELGRQFAELHRFRGKQFGFTEDNFLGSSPQNNRPTPQGHQNWATFYGENRLDFQSKLAEKNGYATPELRKLLERLIVKLADLLAGTEEPPSLLHGDLWSGNYLLDQQGRPWLIDPAVYYGHREADLAMTSLFGGFSASFYSAYEATFPLRPGYSEREPLYHLYHLLNHLNLFGTGYYGQVISILRHYAGQV